MLPVLEHTDQLIALEAQTFQMKMESQTGGTQDMLTNDTLLFVLG